MSTPNNSTISLSPPGHNDPQPMEANNTHDELYDNISQDILTLPDLNEHLQMQDCKGIDDVAMGDDYGVCCW